MKALIFIPTFFFILVFFSTCGDPTSYNEDGQIKFTLSVDRSIGPSPIEANFTGTLHGKIDTLKLFYPPAVLYHGDTKTVIRYAQNDTFIYARETYNLRHEYTSSVPDTYSAYMLLQGLNKDYLSDTLKIIIE